MQSRNEIIDDCVSLLEQAASLISRIEDSIFVTTTPISPRGSIGGHVRHILDFYHSFLTGIGEQYVDYNKRKRNALVEQHGSHALELIQRTIIDLRGLINIDLNRHLLVSMENESSWCRSSILRELDFLKSHTIHHYSLIAILLRLHEIDPGEEFGVAPSTLRYWKQETVCAR